MYKFQLRFAEKRRKVNISYTMDMRKKKKNCGGRHLIITTLEGTDKNGCCLGFSLKEF